MSFPILNTRVRDWVNRYALWAAFALIGLLFTLHFCEMLGHWQGQHGYEPEWVALAIVKGHGFSFPGDHHWLFDDANPDEYYPAAWVEPVFAYLFAACLWLFGEYGRLVIAGVNLVLLAATMVVVFQLGKYVAGRLGGLLCVALIILHWSFHSPPPYYDDAMLGALMVSISALMLLRCQDQFTLRALLGLGVILGLTVLACPATMLFPPTAAVVLLTVRSISIPRRAVGALIATVVAAAVISPWTLRNYLTFGEFVPVRTGLGQIAYVGTVALAATFKPGAAKSDVPVPWKANGPRQAVKQVKESRRALEQFQMDVLAADPPASYATMNEAQRDAVYRTRAKDFVFENPVTAAQLAVFKMYLFGVALGGKLGLVWIGLALISVAILGMTDHRVRALFLLFVAYALPFSIIICYFGRYRRPVEPLVVMLVGIGIASLAQHLVPRFRLAGVKPADSEVKRDIHEFLNT